MSFEEGIFGRTWDDIRDAIDRHLDRDFLSRLGPYPDGASAEAHAATLRANPDPEPARVATAKPLPPNMNPADPDYGSRGLPPVRTPINQCNDEDADACTNPDFRTFTTQTSHNPSYWSFDDVVRHGIDIHEDSHKPWLQYWLDGLPWQDRLRSALNPTALNEKYEREYRAPNLMREEVQAHKAEADYLENYLNTHPNDPNYSALQQRWLDRWQKIDDYKNGRLKK